jgi:integrase
MVDAARPQGKDYIVFDEQLPGFGLRVMPSGKKSYLIQYRRDRRTRRLTFGRHGSMTPSKARTKAIELLSFVAAGEDPAEEQKRARQMPTLAALCQRFLEEYVAQHCKASTAREYRRSVELFITPALGHANAAEISRADIAKLHHDLRHIPYQANRTLGVLGKIFNLAELWGLRPDGSNPCRHVKRYVEEKRERFLTPEEMTRLGEVLRQVEQDGSETASAVAAIRLLALTGCRLSEILTLKWDYIGEDAFHLPDSKTGRRKIYVGEAVIDVLAKIERLPDNPYVITGRKPGARLTDLQHPWQRIRKRAGLEDVRIHDLRHSFASGAIAIGETLPVLGKLLGHRVVQTTARYAHLAADPAKAAADRISSSLATAINGR